MMNEYRIPVRNIGTFREKIEKLTRRAKKLGQPAPIVRVDPMVWDESKKEAYHQVHIDPAVAMPKLDGWRFLALLQHETAGNVIRNISGEELAQEWRTAPSACGHCRTRRSRKETALLRHTESGELRQVGRSCLVDFIGHGAEQIASLAEYIDELNHVADDCYGGSGSGDYSDMIDFLALVVREIEQDGGYVSAATARATEGLQSSGMAAWGAMMKGARANEEYVQTAQEILAWGRALPANGSEYEFNLRTLALTGAVRFRDANLAASMVAAYRRDKVPAPAKSETRISAHVGKPGQKIACTVHVEKIILSEGMYGITRIHVMRDAEGNRLVWFASGAPLDEGAEVQIKATVKAHGERNGEKQTILTRCKAV